MSTIDDLFCGTNVVSTADVARAFDMSEANAREWADELEVAKIGASFAWAQADVESLVEQLDDSGDDDDSDDDDPDDDDSDDESADGADEDSDDGESEDEEDSGEFDE